jgi:hypothetical protein
VTRLATEDVVGHLEGKARSKDAIELGTMYQLSRTSENLNTVRISSPFRLSELGEEWAKPSWSRVGKTNMSQDQISAIGLSL